MFIVQNARGVCVCVLVIASGVGLVNLRAASEQIVSFTYLWPMLAGGLVLGAGFGGLELSTILSEALGDRLDLTLIDRSDSFFFGRFRQNNSAGGLALFFLWLDDQPIGTTEVDNDRHAYADAVLFTTPTHVTRRLAAWPGAFAARLGAWTYRAAAVLVLQELGAGLRARAVERLKKSEKAKKRQAQTPEKKKAAEAPPVGEGQAAPAAPAKK